MILFLRKDGIIPHKASFFKAVKKNQDQFIRIMGSALMHWMVVPREITSRTLKILS